jgi:hypothetical protein
MSTSEARSEKAHGDRVAVEPASSSSAASENIPEGLINASGHKQELDRNFSLISLCGVAITTGNTWTAIGGSVVSCGAH